MLNHLQRQLPQDRIAKIKQWLGRPEFYDFLDQFRTKVAIAQIEVSELLKESIDETNKPEAEKALEDMRFYIRVINELLSMTASELSEPEPWPFVELEVRVQTSR